MIDVIIIGSGAGGGTLARHLAPSGKRILILERGGWLPREPQNWQTSGRVRGQPLHLAGHLVRRQGQVVPAADPLLRRRRDQAVRRGALPAAGGGLRRTAPPRRDLAGVADLVRRHGAVLHARPSRCTRCTAPGARIRPSRRRARRTRSRRSPTSRASSSSPTTWPRTPASTRSTRRAAFMLNESNMPYSTCVRCPTCDGFPCLVHAKADAEVMGVRPALEYPNVTLLTDAMAVRLETNPAGTEVTGGGRRARGTRRAVRRATSSSSPPARRTRPSCCCARPRQAPERPGQRLRPGRPQLHVPRQPGRTRPVQGAEPDRLPEDAGRQRLLLRAARTSRTRWATSR